MGNTPTQVVAALIWNGDRFLACQRPAHKARGLLWEFVGGKVEPGETKQEALVRECQEELAVTISVGEVFMELLHEYPDMTVQLTLFNAVITEGIPKKLEHHDIRWITTDQIDCFDFCPADKEILERLKTIHTGLQARLLALQDEKYRAFHCRLMPTVPPEKVIGVRTPILKKLARELKKAPDTAQFLKNLPHHFYEENNLHGMLISEIKDYDETIAALNAFLPFVDNWATCDLISPKSFRLRPAPLLPQIRMWLSDKHPYAVRFGIGMLLKFYLDEQFADEQLEWVASIQSQEYYINMMIAWYFATALAKQYSSAIVYLEERRLPAWIHRKTIQKAIESYRITDAQKQYLRTLKGGEVSC